MFTNTDPSYQYSINKVKDVKAKNVNIHSASSEILSTIDHLFLFSLQVILSSETKSPFFNVKG
jgi:hypothetical protein